MEVLKKTADKYELHLIAFVLMDNHYHMLGLTPLANLGECMLYFGREVSKQIGLISGRINRIFGGRYQRSLIERDTYYRNALKYVYRNPVEAGLCRRVEEYPFSTLQWQLKGASEVPLYLPPKWMEGTIPKEQEHYLKWLNTPFPGKHRELVRLGLRRSRFTWAKATRYRKDVHELEYGKDFH